jgi:predicted RNase H-like nuclease (RuvC/YqgF family)
MAAALFAFDAYADRFERITRKVPPQFDRGEVIERVVTGDASVEAVLHDLADDDGDEEAESTHEPRELSPEERRIKRLERQVERLESQVDDLEGQLAEKDERIAEYEDELSEARREERREVRERREVNRLERETERLERERDQERERADELESKLDRLKTLWKLDHSDFADVSEGRDLVPVKVIEQFTRDAIDDADAAYGLAAGDVVYLRDASGAGRSTAERLAATEPRLVLRSGNLSNAADEVLFEAEVPVAPADDVTVQEVDELAVARESEVVAAVEDWERRAEERSKERKSEMVDQIISEHRAESGD